MANVEISIKITIVFTMHCCQLLLGLVLVSTCTGIPCETLIISRENWGASVPRKNEVKPSAGKVFVHHTNTDECNNYFHCVDKVKEVEKFHQDILGTEDLDMHFLIAGNGLVYEGLGWNARGLHTPEYPNDFGVSFVGVFEENPANNLMMKAFERLIECGIENGKIDFFHSIYGHKDVRCSTSCPGAYLYKQLKDIPEFHKGGKLEKTCNV